MAFQDYPGYGVERADRSVLELPGNLAPGFSKESAGKKQKR
jgi:hypothetical protein